MTDDELRSAYERGLARGGQRPPLDDVAAERIRKLVEREGREEDRLHTLDSLLSSADGRRELDVVWAAARAARPRSRRRGVWLVAASVVLAAGVTSWWWSGRTVEQELRGDASPITLVAPRGDAGANPRFVWRPFPDAARYSLVVVDSAGNDVFTTETLDTAVTMPDSMQLNPGVQYHWWVEATTLTGAKVTAQTRPLTIREQR